MRNDVKPPPPLDGVPMVPPVRPPAAAHGQVPHPDRAHSLRRTSDTPATGPLYDTPEDRGGISSMTLSIIVVGVVASALLVIAWTVFRGF